MHPNLSIRLIEATDAPNISSLSEELGYSIDTDIISAQIREIAGSSTNVAFVAVIDGEIVGYAHAFIVPRLNTAPFWELAALVVSARHRRKGIASALVQRVEKQASADHKVRVRCNVKRSEAHTFYERLGYRTIKEQKVFEK